MRDDYILIEVKAAAVNPTDWKHIDRFGTGGETIGSDLCGIIVDIGPKVNKQWKRGDRVATVVHGGNSSQHEDGAFGDYAVAKGDLGMLVPQFLSDEEAAGLGGGVTACGQALYQSLGLPLPGSDETRNQWILIYGASTSTGTLAVQYAKLSGCRVIGICSPQNFDLVRSRGAEAVYDYHDPQCADKVKEYTEDDLQLVLDCISTGASSQICERSISHRGGAISHLLPAKHTRPDVKTYKTMGYTAMGEAFDKFGTHTPANLEDFEHAKEFWSLTQGLVEGRKLLPHPIRAGKGGFHGLLAGIDELRRGKVSGMKWVYRIN